MPARALAVDAEIAAIEKEMADRDSGYWKDEAKQQRYRDLVSIRDHAAPPEAMAVAARDFGMAEADASVTWEKAMRMEESMSAEVRVDINASLGQLPGELRGGIVREFAMPVPAVGEATPQQLEAFADTEAGAILMAKWCPYAPRRLATIQARWQRVRAGLDDDEWRWLDWFIDESLQPAEVAVASGVLAA